MLWFENGLKSFFYAPTYRWNMQQFHDAYLLKCKLILLTLLKKIAFSEPSDVWLIKRKIVFRSLYANMRTMLEYASSRHYIRTLEICICSKTSSLKTNRQIVLRKNWMLWAHFEEYSLKTFKIMNIFFILETICFWAIVRINI